MELTKEELERYRKETGLRVHRVNAFVGDGMTPVTDPVQRKEVVDELIKLAKGLEDGSITSKPLVFNDSYIEAPDND